MKIKFFILSILFLFIIKNIVVGQGLYLNFVNKQMNGNIWTFDLEGTADATYSGANDNWSTMNVRLDVVVQSGITFIGQTGVPNIVYVSTVGTQISVPGNPPAGSIEFGITLDRNSGLLDIPTTPVILGTFTFTFSNIVPTTNLVTPRPTPNISGSFYTTLEDATTRRPFILPFNFPLVNVPLGVTLINFAVKKYTQNSSKLFWTTSYEIITDFYDIERSLDSKNWENIGKVKAVGNSKEWQSYEFIDDKLILRRSDEIIFYYRLKIVDLDGQYKYSEIRDVNFGKIKTPDLIIHPNPTNDIINLDLTVFDKNVGPIEINVYDMNGKQVLNRITGNTGLESVDLSTLPANTYNISVKQGELIYNEKVVKVQ